MSELLSESQRAALEQLQQITAAEDPDREIAVLRSVNWNVEKAAQAFFSDDTSSSPPQPGPSASASRPSTSTSRTVEQMIIDDADQGEPSSISRRPARRGVAPAYPTGRGPRAPAAAGTWNVLSILSFPFSLIGGILQFIFRLLRFPFGGAGGPTLRPGSRGIGGLGLGLGSGRTIAEDPATVAERFVQELEDETGALTVAHAAAQGVSGNDKSGSSGSGKATDSTKLLPDFFIGSYEQALKAAETDLKVLCAIILSSEHDDVPEFRRTVLTDPEFVKVLTDNDFLVYAGDIRYREAYQTGQKLGATTYPSVTFISLHPVPQHLGGPSATRSGSGPKLTVLSRHEGSPSSKTSATALTTHITASLLPRVTPLLSRLRTERWERAQERRLREEQDKAFAETAARDKERVLKRQAEERAAAEAAKRAEEERKAREAKKANTAAWRRYARRMLVLPEPSSTSGAVRVGVRMPDGKRVVRMFDSGNTAVDVYTFVETLFIPASDDPSTDPTTPPPGFSSTAEPEHEWAFGLVTSYPRKEIPPSKTSLLGDIPEFKGGANLALEMKESLSNSAGNASEGEDEEDSENDDDD